MTVPLIDIAGLEVAAETPADIQPYSGLNLGYLSEKARAATPPVLPAGLGVRAGFVGHRRDSAAQSHELGVHGFHRF